jgi:hypothetical protein
MDLIEGITRMTGRIDAFVAYLYGVVFSDKLNLLGNQLVEDHDKRRRPMVCTRACSQVYA